MPEFFAYIDESGGGSDKPKDTDHFIMSGIMVRQPRLPLATALLATMRHETGRTPGTCLHWSKSRSKEHRKTWVEIMGRVAYLRKVSIVTNKRHVGKQTPGWRGDNAYFYALQLLLERVSWIVNKHAQDSTGTCEVTVARFHRMSDKELQDAVDAMRARDDSRGLWSRIEAKVKVCRPEVTELLQLADIAAAATGAAFNGEFAAKAKDYAYLRDLRGLLDRGPSGKGDVTTYGLKMHPWNATLEAQYPWIKSL